MTPEPSPTPAVDDVPARGDLLSAIEATLWLSRNIERTAAPLTTSQFRIMRRAAAGGDRAARLAERLAVRKPTVSSIVDGLVAAGLLLRGADPTDRRAVRLGLTAEGHTALAETEHAYAERFAELLGDTIRPTDLLALLVDLEDGRVARLNGSTPKRSITSGAPPTTHGHTEPDAAERKDTDTMVEAKQ